jgi:hypothetical protein
MKHLTDNKQFNEGIETLFNHKPKKKQYLKFAEELAELSAAILKHINKGESEEFILEEMVDVSMHINLISKHFSPLELKTMCEAKTKKFLSSKDFNKYKQKSLLTVK